MVFPAIDVIEVLAESPRPRKYWNALKTKLLDEGSELSLKLGQLKLKANDGKMRETDVADTQSLLRLIQSIPSPKAEPFKMWLAKVGYERMQEISDPEQSLITNVIHQEWTGMTVKTHKDVKGLEGQNLMDHMTEAELLFTALAELSTRQIAESDEAEGLEENAVARKKGGKIAKDARLALEAKTGKKVVSEKNFLDAEKSNKKIK